MGVNVLIRVADVFFTACLLIAATLGVVLVWAMGNLNQFAAALLAVALRAPTLLFYGSREHNRAAKARWTTATGSSPSP